LGGAIGKDTASRVWRRVKSDWDTWNARSLANEPLVWLILDTSAARSRWTGAMAAMIKGASERANSGLASRISKQSDERLPCEFMLL
jgi:hypothetical protein